MITVNDLNAVEQAAFHEATRIGVADLAAALQDLLGQRLTALIAGVTDLSAVGDWARGARLPQPEKEQRLRTAFQIARLLLRSDERPTTVRAWFAGTNPFLNDRSPAIVLRDDPQRVMQAARVFLADA